ncbi:uncharacterized protein LOC130495770 [Raphanus sativus]|uniref:Uncharacterized protein LOC130495770 n=1 Tax=Raphanus sativus TaxID=3726 RepID=A0A9W3BV65_RAPSA|nr:uncharacterized protein LOC130495770 [Raphanus sativus]
MTERETYVKMTVAHAKAMEANNKFVATLEKRLQDVSRSDEILEIKKVVRELKLSLKLAQERKRANTDRLTAADELENQAVFLKVRLRVTENKRKLALEQVSFIEL